MSNFVSDQEIKSGVKEESPPKKEETSSEEVDSSISQFKIKELPSAGIPYPEGWEISYRPYTFGEVKKVSSSNMTLYDLIKGPLLNGVECKGFDPLDLTVNDFIYISLVRRANTTGKEFAKASWVCERCGYSNSDVIRAEDLEFEDVKATEYPIPITLDSGETLKVGTLTVRDLLRIHEEDLDDKDEITVLALSIVDSGKSIKELHDLIENASYKEGLAIEEADNDLVHGILPVQFSCSRDFSSEEEEGQRLCGHKQSIELESRDVLISPFR